MPSSNVASPFLMHLEFVHLSPPSRCCSRSRHYLLTPSSHLSQLSGTYASTVTPCSLSPHINLSKPQAFDITRHMASLLLRTLQTSQVPQIPCSHTIPRAPPTSSPTLLLCALCPGMSPCGTASLAWNSFPCFCNSSRLREMSLPGKDHSTT